MAVNKVILLGNVGKPPVVETLTTQKKVAKFSLATTEKAYTLKNGTQVPEKTEWHQIVAWGKIAEIVEQYVNGGSKVYIEGKNRTRSYQKSGVPCYITEIHVDTIQVLSGRKAEENVNNHAQPEVTYRADDDDLPF